MNDQNDRNRSAAIRNLQLYLRQLSYHDPAITPPPVDGIYDSDTRRAVGEFQKSAGLPVTGIADQATWEAVFDAYRVSVAAYSLPKPLAVFPADPADCRLKIGERSFAVAAVQMILRELESEYGGIGFPEVTGDYTEETTRAVRFFQRQNGLNADGEVDRVTWNLLADRYNLLREE